MTSKRKFAHFPQGNVGLKDWESESPPLPVTVGRYGQSQPSCFNRVQMGFMMGWGLRGRELLGGVGKTMMQSGGTFGTFMAIGMGIRC
ncbi:reactive oxygen species modulator 1-like [Scyliorhinus torazame]|uniref:reactive oxygen species modulator 1-like n=1 Tax=Scyliorhinus torazame TaxID=75743 RepID=UPI003B58EB99